jgi:hypothetical protein
MLSDLLIHKFLIAQICQDLEVLVIPHPLADILESDGRDRPVNSSVCAGV